MKKKIKLLSQICFVAFQAITSGLIIASCGDNTNQNSDQQSDQQNNLNFKWESTKLVLNNQDVNACYMSNKKSVNGDEEIEIKIKDEYITEWALCLVSYYFVDSNDEKSDETIVFDTFANFDYKHNDDQFLNFFKFTIKNKDINDGCKIYVSAFVSRWFIVKFVTSKNSKINGWKNGDLFYAQVHKYVNDSSIFTLPSYSSGTLKANIAQQNITNIDLLVDQTSKKISISINKNFTDKLDDNTLTINVTIE